MTFKWDVCAKMAAKFFFGGRGGGGDKLSLWPMRSAGGGVNEFMSSVLKALQSTAYKSGVNVISAAVLHGPLTSRLIGRLPFASN